jgi:hypothetical protein
MVTQLYTHSPSNGNFAVEIHSTANRWIPDPPDLLMDYSRPDTDTWPKLTNVFVTSSHGLCPVVNQAGLAGKKPVTSYR